MNVITVACPHPLFCCIDAALFLQFLALLSLIVTLVSLFLIV